MFLDEIGEMTLTLQAKLLRFLEEKALRRVGGGADITVDVRVVAATNRDLESAVQLDTRRAGHSPKIGTGTVFEDSPYVQRFPVRRFD